METAEALRVVQGLLNHYKAVQRIAEVLDNVQAAETRLAELKAEQDKVAGLSEAMRGEMANVGAALGAAKKEFEDTKDAQKQELQANEDAVAARIASANKELDRVVAKIDEAEAKYKAAVEAGEAKVADLAKAADREEQRMAKVQKKIAELKGL